MRFSAWLPTLTAIATLGFAAAPFSVSLPQSQPRVASTTPATDPIDINTASLDQLMKVPGLTRTWAARIIRYRPYRGKNELLDRGIVTGEVYARIKDHIIARRSAPGGSHRN